MHCRTRGMRAGGVATRCAVAGSLEGVPALPRAMGRRARSQRTVSENARRRFGPEETGLTARANHACIRAGASKGLAPAAALDLWHGGGSVAGRCGGPGLAKPSATHGLEKAGFRRIARVGEFTSRP